MVSDIFTVRDAVDDDADAIALLIGELGYPTTGAVIRERSAAATAAGAGRVIVCVGDAAVLGVATLFHIRTLHRPGGGVCRITSLVVTQAARGRGVGRRLVEEIERHARATACARIEVTSAPHREDAHLFYWRLGYLDAPRRFIKLVQL